MMLTVMKTKNSNNKVQNKIHAFTQYYTSGTPRTTYPRDTPTINSSDAEDGVALVVNTTPNVPL